MRIAIADDDPEIISFLQNIIEDMEHVCVSFSDGDKLASALLRDTFDLILVDWNMPGKSGLEIIHWVKESLDEAPAIIMMTSRSAKQDISEALNAGADDYITKPEDETVIAARIGAILRRSAPPHAMTKTVAYGRYEFDRMDQAVSFDGKTVKLTSKEFDLSELLFRNRDRTLSRAYIMETVWRTNADLATRTLDMHVSRLRSKLSLSPENGFRIFTVFGYGYRLETMKEA
ncbi:response regulator transcription factor [Alterisphingorhabdus coralli]|uniref:Response regulator transcription factor n=1 Tax=Alterisphingorhabdus coralli TaxID=3071408 RepID=A0AA97I3B0_9SPHN|nr:response regulator transcription factor [Parasphingorhabdus sp. SCSIO 66989]WOE76595.1 response regulator transcription factor [Parasphingorhabdus sp. SCSIO 66989]